MVKYELFCILIVSLIWSTASQGSITSAENKTSNKDEPPDKLILSTPQPLNQREDQQSFMSKLVSWILPFGESADERRDFTSGLHYPSKAHSQSHIEKDCNPCNLEPWIPIIPNTGDRTIINFVPPVKNLVYPPNDFLDLNVLDTLHPPALPYKTSFRQFVYPGHFATKNPIKYPQRVQSYISPSNNKDDVVVVDYMLPPPVNYKIPSLIYGPQVYNPPPVKNTYASSKPVYNPIPYRPFVREPAVVAQLPQTPSTYAKHISQDYVPPQFSNFHSNYQSEPVANSFQVFPSDSYGAPVTGETLNYFSPPEQLSLPDEQKPYMEKIIPLPNLSSIPVVPFRNYGDFNQNRIGSQYNDNTNVKIQQSVKIADYLAAIEHPVNVVQSPLIELSIKDDHFEENESDGVPHTLNSVHSRKENHRPINILNSELYKSQTENEDDLYNREEKAKKIYGNIKEKLQQSNENLQPLKLSENPIVVEDIHAAASSNNDTFVNSNELQTKRNNKNDLKTQIDFADNDLKVPSKQSEFLSGSSIIKQLLLQPKTELQSANSFESSHYVQSNFTISPLDYSNWKPASPMTESSFPDYPLVELPTTKKPKLLQIIVPYVSSKKTDDLFDQQWANKSEKRLPGIFKHNGDYTTLLPVFTPPATTEVSDWTKFITLETTSVTSTVIPKVTTAVYNIKELLNNRPEYISKDLPFDILTLQKHIDNWTQQAYSKNIQRESEKLSTPKKIPAAYLTPQNSDTYTDITTIKADVSRHNVYEFVRRKKAEDGPKQKDIDTNFIEPMETGSKMKTPLSSKSTKRASLKDYKPQWNTSQITVSPQTKEKVYVVTPQVYNNFHTSTPATAWSTAPKVENGKVNNKSTHDSYRFSIRVEPQNKTRADELKHDGKGALKVVYTEWPHLINNLETTTKKPTIRHALFGLMDIPAYTHLRNSSIETFSGHSRVATAVTSTTISEREVTTPSITEIVK